MDRIRFGECNRRQFRYFFKLFNKGNPSVIEWQTLLNTTEIALTWEYRQIVVKHSWVDSGLSVGEGHLQRYNVC